MNNKQVFQKSSKVKKLLNDFLDLFQALTKLNPSSRIYLKEILSHPWFKTDFKISKEEFEEKMRNRVMKVSEFYSKLAEKQLYKLGKIHSKDKVPCEEYTLLDSSIKDFITSIKSNLIYLRKALLNDDSISDDSSSSKETKGKNEYNNNNSEQKKNQENNQNCKQVMNRKESNFSDCSYIYSSDED